MKKHKGNHFTILLGALIGMLFLLCIASCILVTRFIVLKQEILIESRAETISAEKAPDQKEEGKEAEPDFSETDLSPETSEDSTFAVVSKEPGKFSGHILIGDSRMVMLQRGADYAPTDVFICKGAMSYDWFSTEAVSQLRNVLDQDPDYAVVINMGINDCANNCAGWTEYFVKDYVDTINSLCMDYPSTKFYFASVGHIKNYYMATRGPLPEEEVNAYVDIFNEYMRNNAFCNYIDVCEHLDEVGYVWADNVHYATATNQEIYDYIVMKVNANNPEE